ncbi:MAG: alpha/beta fold hydrolase [Leptolyngbya sp.]|nr:alpha/beta fold hydrolase [Candidatus Melainabacteria bacterium]
MQTKLQIVNACGASLSAVLHQPIAQASVPLVIVLHGFTGFKEEESMVSFSNALEDSGIASIRFDTYGFGDSDGTPEEHFRVSHYLQDILCVYEHVCRLDFVDSESIGICGHSLGGCLSLIFASLVSNIRATCAVQPCTKLTRPGSSLDLEDWRRRGFFERVCDPPLNKYVRLPAEFAEDADKFDALDYVSKIKSPIHIIYGESDVDVLPSDTRRLFDAADCPKTIIGLEGVEHGFKRNPDHLREVTASLRKFFEYQLSSAERSR